MVHINHLHISQTLVLSFKLSRFSESNSSSSVLYESFLILVSIATSLLPYSLNKPSLTYIRVLINIIYWTKQLEHL